MTTNRSLVYLRRNGYFTQPESTERVVHSIITINGLQFGKIRYKGNTQICIKADLSGKDEWYCLSGQFPLTYEYEKMLEEEE